MKKTLRSLIAVSLLLTLSAFAAKAKKGNYLDWVNTPEAYFLTTEERAQWDRVLSKEEADKFITDYWARHGEAFRRDLQQRIAAADKYFGLQDIPGSETPKGRVFIILGSPNQQKNVHAENDPNETPSMLNNTVERASRVTTEWLYKKDRLPADLAVPELLVRFQTNVNRGEQVIENPGLVEPYLKRASDYYAKKWLSNAASTTPAAQTPTQTKAAVGAAPAAPNAIWSSTANLNGAFFTGEPFVSPTEKPFYAYSFYLPQSVASLAGAKDVVLVGSVKNAAGDEVANVRQPVTPSSYDATGDRYADGAVELAPGKYTGAFGIYTSDGATLLASARTDFEVVDPSLTRVGHTFLTSHIDTLDKQGAFDPFTFVAMKYAVKGNSKFKKSDSIGYFTFIANPAANPTPSMTMRMKVSKDGKVIDNTPPMPADLQQTGPHTYLLATRFDPNTLSPGHYTIDITLRDMNAPKDSDAYAKGYTSSTSFDVVE